MPSLFSSSTARFSEELSFPKTFMVILSLNTSSHPIDLGEDPLLISVYQCPLVPGVHQCPDHSSSGHRWKVVRTVSTNIKKRPPQVSTSVHQVVGGVNKAAYNRLDYCRQARVSHKWREFRGSVVLTGRSKENGQQVGRKGKQEALTSSKILASPLTSG